MKIWFLCQHAAPNNLPGSSRAFDFAKEWSEQGEQVVVWLANFSHVLRRRIKPAEKTLAKADAKFKLRWLWSFKHVGNDWRRILNMVTFACNLIFQAMFTKKPDIILASSPPLLVPLAGWLLARFKRIPFVLEVRDLWPESLVVMNGLKQKSLVARLLSWLATFLYHKADKIVVLTNHQRDALVKRGVAREVVTLIPNGVAVSKIVKPKLCANFYQQFGVPANAFVALYAGAHGPANGLQSVALAAKYLPKDIYIVLVGDGPEKEALIKFCQQQKINQVKFLPVVSKENIYEYTFNAGCGIISLQDNDIFRGARPNKLFDYAFAGLPIVTNVDGEVREVVEGYGLGVFAPPNNPGLFASAIEKIRLMPDSSFRQIKAAGHRYIERHGDRVKAAERYLKLLQQSSKLQRVIGF
ncbi:MAG: hypothetical protein RLZ12_888 [Bacillota bacterium]